MERDAVSDGATLPAAGDRSGPALIVLGLGASKLRDEGRRRLLAERAADAARARGHREVMVKECPDAASLRAEVAAGISADAGLVVAIGGDGTIREATGVLSGTGIPLGIVPAGTGNLLASSLGLPRRTDSAIAAIRDGVPRVIDHGHARWATRAEGAGPGDSPFVVAAGVGLDARFITAATGEAKRRYGIGAYVLAALAQATDLRPRPTTITVDGVTHRTEAIVVLIANAGELVPGLLGPRLPILPDDGLLHVFVVRGGVVGSALGLLELLARADEGWGPTGSGMRARGRAIAVDVESRPAEPVEVDGDRVGSGRLEAVVRPGALVVLVPRA
jgi:diacylglycerol kinase (ATP)